MPDYKLISADSHVSEPPDLWATRVDKKYRERAPQLMVNPPGKEGAYFHLRGLRAAPDRHRPRRRQEPRGAEGVPDQGDLCRCPAWRLGPGRADEGQ